MISGLLVLPFAGPMTRYLSTLRKHWRLMLLVTFLQIIVNYAFFYLGLQVVPGALGAVVAGSQPLITALVAALLHEDERLTTRKIVTIICGISGVVLISAGRQAFRLGTSIELLGVGMILVANTSLSLGNILVSLRSKGISPFILSSFSLFTGGATLYLISLPVEGLTKAIFPREYWFILLWLSFMAATAFSIWFTLLQRPGVRVSELNLWKFIIPVAGAILSWLLVPGERPEMITISGMIIITGSLILFFNNSKDSKSDKYSAG